MDRFGLDMQSAFGMPPVAYVRLAARLGCGHVTTALTPLPWNPCGFPTWSLRDDPNLRREVMAAMADGDVILSVLAGFSIKAQVDVRDLAPDMDLAAALGVRMLGTVGMEPDIPRAHDQLAFLTQMASERGMQVVLDYAPHHPIRTLEAALAALRHVAKPQARLSLDAMHFFRTGGVASDLAALDPQLIGYAQVCDVPRVAPHADYAREATFERLIPGEGELPLADFVAALPHDVLIGVEVPSLAEVEARRSLDAFLARAVQASRALL